MSKVFTYRDLAIRVEGDAAPLQWLKEFLAPAFAVRDGGTADCSVVLEVNGREYGAALARGARHDGAQAGCFALDGGMIRLPCWTPAADERLLCDGAAHLFYGVSGDGATVRVLTDEQRPSRRVGLMRAVRELATSRAWSATSAVLHAAALAIGDVGIVIAGPKGAGKTTLLLQLLLGGRAAAFVSNDRVVVDTAGGDLRLHGMPTIVKVLRPPAERLPALHARLAPAHGDFRLTIAELAAQRSRRGALAPPPAEPLQCTAAQLCALLGARMQSHARAAVLLFPRVNESGARIQLAALSPPAAAARLRALVLGGPRPALSEVFALAVKPGCIDSAALDGLCRMLAQGARSFECLLGRDADQPAAARDLLDRILADDAEPRAPRRAAH